MQSGRNDRCTGSDLKAAQEKLMTSAQKLFAKLYEQQGEQQALVPEQQVQARIWEMQEQQAAMTTMS